MRRSTPKRESDWLTIKELARAFGVTVRGFEKAILPHIPREWIRQTKVGKHNRNLYYGRGVIEAWALRHQEVPDNGDPLLTVAAGSSPALERYRAARAKIAELELDERQGLLMHVDRVREIYSQMGAAIQRALRMLRQRGETAAHQVVEKALKEANTKFDEGVK